MEVDLAGFERDLERRSLSPRTITAYLGQVDKPFDRLRSRKLAPKSRRLIKSAFKAYARYLGGEEGEALSAELADVKLPAPARRRQQVPLPRPIYDRLREEIKTSTLIDDPSRVVLGLMAFRGFRRGDALRIKKSEVAQALKTGVLSFEGKGERILEFGVTENYQWCLELARDLWHGHAKTICDLVSVSEGGAAQKIDRDLKVLAQELPLKKHGVELEDVRCHILRRTYAVTVFEAFGHDVMKLKSHLQWQSLETASSYVDWQDAAALDNLAEKMFK